MLFFYVSKSTSLNNLAFQLCLNTFFYTLIQYHLVMMIDPRGRSQFRSVVITIFTQCPSVYPSVRPYVCPKTSKSSDNHCRPGLWAGRVDHWWLLSCSSCFQTRSSVLSYSNVKDVFQSPSPGATVTAVTSSPPPPSMVASPSQVPDIVSSIHSELSFKQIPNPQGKIRVHSFRFRMLRNHWTFLYKYTMWVEILGLQEEVCDVCDVLIIKYKIFTKYSKPATTENF